MTQPETSPESHVDRLYRQLRRMAADFEFKPEARINESRLSEALGTSRTPLREALNRLAAQGFLTNQGGRGFFCRALNPDRILDLYGARLAVEAETTRQAALQASQSALDSFYQALFTSEPAYLAETDPELRLTADEAFHMRIAQLSGNAEMAGMLDNLNARIRYVRLVDMQRLRDQAQSGARGLTAHLRIAKALKDRQSADAVSVMRQHIDRRRDEILAAVRAAYSQLYVPDFEREG